MKPLKRLLSILCILSLLFANSIIAFADEQEDSKVPMRSIAHNWTYINPTNYGYGSLSVTTWDSGTLGFTLKIESSNAIVTFDLYKPDGTPYIEGGSFNNNTYTNGAEGYIFKIHNADSGTYTMYYSIYAPNGGTLNMWIYPTS